MGCTRAHQCACSGECETTRECGDDDLSSPLVLRPAARLQTPIPTPVAALPRNHE